MPAMAGTKRMWMRFDLLQRTPGQAEYEPVQGCPQWGVWQRSQPGRDGFIYTKSVQGLRAPGSYRARVRFRWYDAAGKPAALGHAHERGPVGSPTRARPAAGALTAVPGLGAEPRPTCSRCATTAAAPAGPFDVVLAVAGDAAAGAARRRARARRDDQV